MAAGQPTPETPPRGRAFRLTLDVREHDGARRASAARADGGQVLAACDAETPADALAGATAALTSIIERLEVDEGVQRAIHAIAELLPPPN
jgi:hypothetical protein